MARIPLRKTGWAAAIAFGAMIGIGVFTFGYAQGFSYFSSNPQTCVNCHIMRQEYDGWEKASHHAVAGCVDCHLPPQPFARLVAEAANGYNHSRAFTFQDFHQPVMIKPRNSQILQDNCLRCHGDFVHQIVSGSTTDRDAVRCVHCHWSVGHGQRQ